LAIAALLEALTTVAFLASELWALAIVAVFVALSEAFFVTFCC